MTRGNEPGAVGAGREVALERAAAAVGKRLRIEPEEPVWLLYPHVVACRDEELLEEVAHALPGSPRAGMAEQ